MKLIKLYFLPGNRYIKSYIFKLKKKVSHLVFGLPYASSYSLPLLFGWTRYLPIASFGSYCHSYQLVLGTIKVLFTFSKIWPITIKCWQTLDTPTKAWI